MYFSLYRADDYNDPADAVLGANYDVPNPGRGGRPNNGQVIRPASGIYSEVIDTRKKARGTEETDGGQVSTPACRYAPIYLKDTFIKSTKFSIFSGDYPKRAKINTCK